MSDIANFILLAVFAVLIVWAWRKVFGKVENVRNDEYIKCFLARLHSPDFESVEKHFGVELPLVLKNFYSTSLIDEDYVIFLKDEKECDIAFFEPIDGDSLRESWPGCEKYISIANDGCGNEYIFDPLCPPYAVKFHDHETGEIDLVCASLDEFVEAVRVYAEYKKQS